jgi:hypothetical protein
MHHTLSKRQRVVCCIIPICAAVFYIGFYIYTVRAEWGAKEGDRPPIPLWFQNVSRDAILFPFGFVPGFVGIWVFILNIMFWSALSVIIYVLFSRRKVAA